MTTPPTSAVEAVQRYLVSQPLEQLTTDGARRVAVDLIAAVLDNLPREMMAKAMEHHFAGDEHWRPVQAQAALNAAITAARKEILGHADIAK